MSVHGDLLFMPVEQTSARIDCGTHGAPGTVNPDRFRGVRIFGIGDIRRPVQVAAVQTCRGSHTHMLVTSPADPANVYVYNSGIGGVRPAEELAGCTNSPGSNHARLMADPVTGNQHGLWPGGSHGPGTQSTTPATPATTSPPTRRSGSPPAPARATGS